ncbi:MAG: hypothetical protein ABI051_03240 [Vicinamibacterales bacterium]
MRPRLSKSLDRLVLTLLLLAAAIEVTGGFAFTIAGVHLSARSWHRPLLLAVALFSVRVVLDWRTPPPSVLLRMLRGLYDRRADAFIPLPSGTRWARRAMAWGGLAVLTAIMLHAQLQHMDSVSDLGDPLFSVWRLGWVYHQLVGDPRALFDANIFHPQPLTLTYSDSMLLPALITAPLMAVGIHPVVAMNTVVVGSFLFSAIACYLLVEDLTASAGAGFIAGLLWAFHPFHYEHYSHFELLMAWWIPLSLLGLHRFIRTGRIRHAVFAALMVVAQLYSSMYLAVLYLWFAAAVFLVLCGLARPPVRRVLVGGVLAGGIALALALPLSRVYESAHLHDRPVKEVAGYSATMTDYLRAPSRDAFWAHRSLGDAVPERAMFPGLLVAALALAGLFPPLGMVRTAYVAALVLAVEITLGTNGRVYPALYQTLPFMRGMRVPARASILVGLALAVLAGFAVRRLLAGRSQRWQAGMLACLAAFAVIELRPSFPLEQVWHQPPVIYQAIGGRPGVVLAEFPMGLTPGARLTDTPHMYFSLWHWTQLINGYSGHPPDGYGDFQSAMKPFPAPQTLDLLRARGATHVTVNCALYVEGCDALIEHIERVPDLRLLVAAKWEGQPVRLYELKR